MLNKKLHDIADQVTFDYSKLSKEQTKLIEENNTLDLILELNGSPLIYYSVNWICGLKRSELKTFLNETKIIDEFICTEEAQTATIGSMMEKLSIAADAINESNDKFSMFIQNELGAILDFKANSKLTQIVSDLIVADRYICFNATSKSSLIFRDFELKNNVLDFQIHMSPEIGFKPQSFQQLSKNTDAQILNLRNAICSLLSNSNSELYTMVCSWLNQCEKYRSRIPIFANYYMPYAMYLLKSAGKIESTKTTRYHTQKLLGFEHKNWVGEKITSLLTYKSISKHHKSSLIDSNDIDIRLSIVRHFLQTNFVKLV